jgi:hypothetical protein
VNPAPFLWRDPYRTASLAQQFTALLERIAQGASLDEDTHELAKTKTKAVAEGLAERLLSRLALQNIAERGANPGCGTAKPRPRVKQRTTQDAGRLFDPRA